ncbi:MAG: tetratricopeptide repeat protein [Microscillaceae bacterium]|nr:tetratricopeptide repeat protein [Microscillaceae bacterium]
METLSLVFIFGLYIGIRLFLGHHKTPAMKDRQKYQEGIALVYQKKYTEALDYFQKVLQKDPKSSIAWAFKSECNLYLDNLYQAIADAEKALNIDYSLSECYFYKGLAFYKLEMIEDALTEFEKAVWHFREKHPETFRYRGLCHVRLGRNEQAEKDFRRAIELGDEEANYIFLQWQQKLNVNKNK